MLILLFCCSEAYQFALWKEKFLCRDNTVEIRELLAILYEAEEGVVLDIVLKLKCEYKPSKIWMGAKFKQCGLDCLNVMLQYS